MSLYNDIKDHEGAKTEIYPDPYGIPTIGVGYNLQSRDVLMAVLNQFGYSTDSLGEPAFNTLVNELSMKFSTDWTASNTAENTADVNEILAEYHEKIIDGYDARKEFEFTNTTSDMEPVFNTVVADFEKQIIAEIDNKLSDVDLEKAKEIYNGLTQARKDSLLSLAFNGGARNMIGPNLSAALRDGNWEDAYYEIVFGSNASADVDNDSWDTQDWVSSVNKVLDDASVLSDMPHYIEAVKDAFSLPNIAARYITHFHSVCERGDAVSKRGLSGLKIDR